MQFEFHWGSTSLYIPHLCDINLTTYNALTVAILFVIVKLAKVVKESKSSKQEQEKQVQNEGTELSW